MHLLPAETPLSCPGNRIGLFGGSFNPPHRGHFDAAATALKRLQLDRVWWLVTPGNPLKTNHGLPPLQERVAACRALITDRRMIVTGFEQQLGTTFTADLLAALLRQRRSTRFVWVMGGDGWAELHRWHRWRNIVQSVPIAVVDRPDCRLRALSSPAAHAYARHQIPERDAARLAMARPPAWCYLTAPQNDLSSTGIRQARAP